MRISVLGKFSLPLDDSLCFLHMIFPIFQLFSRTWTTFSLWWGGIFLPFKNLFITSHSHMTFLIPCEIIMINMSFPDLTLVVTRNSRSCSPLWFVTSTTQNPNMVVGGWSIYYGYSSTDVKELGRSSVDLIQSWPKYNFILNCW